MFNLPREIIQLIFEFDSTYREEYGKSLEIINSLPEYYEYDLKLKYESYVYIFRSIHNYKYFGRVTFPPSVYYLLYVNKQSLFLKKK